MAEVTTLGFAVRTLDPSELNFRLMSLLKSYINKPMTDENYYNLQNSICVLLKEYELSDLQFKLTRNHENGYIALEPIRQIDKFAMSWVLSQ